MTEDDTLNQTETLENPYSAYSVKFPYTVSFSFPDDDHNTKITIASTSVVLSYGREETDIPHQMKMDQNTVTPLAQNTSSTGSGPDYGTSTQERWM